MSMISGSWSKDNDVTACADNCGCCLKRKSPHEEKVIEHFGDE